MRRETPPSESLPVAKPFSISSIHSTLGATAVATSSAWRRFFSVSPMYLS